MTPSPKVIGWALVCVGIVIVILALINGWNDLTRSIPFTSQWRAARAEKSLETVTQDRDARAIESDGRAGQLDRQETYHREVITIQSATASSVTEARSAPDASTPLDLDRADRLRRADDSLCQHVACGRPTATDDPT